MRTCKVCGKTKEDTEFYGKTKNYTMNMKRIRRCVRIADAYLDMAQEARNKHKYHDSICFSNKATKFYNLVITFNSKVILILVSINAVLQIITLIIK
jgi:hypothetical protein